MSKKKSNSLSFEDAMRELEVLVDSMEQDTLTLDESLQKFERGVELTRICQQALAKVEQEVKVLTEQGDTVDFSESVLNLDTE